MKYCNIICMLLFAALFGISSGYAAEYPAKNNSNKKPRIVNIINFIRLLEPRDSAITEDVLYQTVANQLKMMEQYNLGGTFLLQYDALMDSRYQKLLKGLPKQYEVGAWWEIPQPLVEKAGMKWRGRYPWDWHANVGFSTGYTPEERKKLVDVYMSDFKKIFGYYPKSVGSWFIDEVTLNYMYEKYGITASCNCRDQIGTDGYTLWGGYWSQAYYPSKLNSYMPAQNENNQIPVPVFRMLGSDPIRQYDNGWGNNIQGVVTLEPVYKDAGGDSSWVDWYFKEFTGGESMGFAYVQAGQENSFTWKNISKGFAIQMKLLANLKDKNEVEIETLAESGKWFRNHYKKTPATSVVTLDDFKNDSRKTVWFDSRFYRANLLWENGALRFRDIHLFDEKLPSPYLTQRGTSTSCDFYTFPFIDGHQWSSEKQTAGLFLKAVINGKETLIEGGMPEVTNPVKGKLHIEWPLKNVNGKFVADFDEHGIKMKIESGIKVDWFLELNTAEKAELPFTKVDKKAVDCEYKGFKYRAVAKKGFFTKIIKSADFRIMPDYGLINLNFSKR